MQLSIEQEIGRARNDGVTHPENLPFLLSPASPSEQSVLLVHGFGATPRELRPLGEYLCQRQFTVLAVRLPGHGTSPEDLANRRLEEWQACCQRGYQLLRNSGRQVNAVGLSTGSLLLLELALQNEMKRLVLLAPYLRLQHPLVPLARMLSYLIPFQERHVDPADKPFYYQRRPLHGIVQINRLRRQVRKRLTEIKTPCLVLSSSGDRTIHPGTAEQLYQLLGSREKQFHSYGDEVPHVLTAANNPCRDDVFKRTARFLQATGKHS